MPMFQPTNPLPRYTYTQAVALTGVPVGYEVVITNWGANGTKAAWSGTRWLPNGGQTVLKRMGAAVSGIAGTETIATQIQMPAGVIQAGDTIALISSLSKTGSVDSAQHAFRAGTLGTSSDAALMPLRGAMAAASLSGGYITRFRVLSNTSWQMIGNGSTNAAAAVSNSSTATLAAATGVADLSSNAVWLSYAVKSSGTTDTVGVQEVTIIHEAG